MYGNRIGGLSSLVLVIRLTWSLGVDFGEVVFPFGMPLLSNVSSGAWLQNYLLCCWFILILALASWSVAPTRCGAAASQAAPMGQKHEKYQTTKAKCLG